MTQFYGDTDWENVPTWECLFVHRKQGLFLSVCADDRENGWKEAKPQPYEEEIDETG